MKKHKLILNGLNCAVCAQIIENSIAKDKKYKNVSLNFASRTLTLEASDEKNEVVKKIQKIVDSVESDVTVSTVKKEKKSTHLTLILGCVFFFIGICINLFAEPSTSAVYIDYIIYTASAISVGYKFLLNGLKTALKLRADENTLLLIACVAAFCIGEYVEACIVVILFALGEIIENVAVNNSRKSIEALSNIRPDSANVIIDGKTVKMPAEKVEVGSVIEVAPFERIPLDCVVIYGESDVDASSLTGESVPIHVTEGFELLSGMQNLSGVLTLKVKNKYSTSAASRILEIVEQASNVKSKSEKLITRFARIYTPIVILIAAIIAFIPPILGVAPFSQMLYRALVILVASCPCAIVISVPLGFYAGIGASSKNGVLIKGSKYIEILSKADSIAFDKTGTLTEGKLSVSKVNIYDDSLTCEDIFALACAVEKYSSHPIAHAIKNAYNGVDIPAMTDYNEFAGKGVRAKYKDKTVHFGNAAFMMDNNIKCDTDESCFLAVDYKLAAGFILSDTVRKESNGVIRQLNSLGFKRTVMLTGDKVEYAEAIAKKCGITEVNSELLPEDKVNIVKDIADKSRACLFVGDGINDAPVIACSDCGIAMGLGSEAATQSADVVLSDGTLKKLPFAIKYARRVMNTVRFNIVLSLAFKATVIILASVGFAPMYLAILADTGVSVLCIANCARLIKGKNYG